MLPDDTRRKIKNITAGALLEGQSDYCTAARNLLCGRYPTSTKVKADFESKAIVKEEQAQLLESLVLIIIYGYLDFRMKKCT